MKKYLIIIVIVGLYLLFALYGVELLNSNTYLFVGQAAKWVYKNGEWSNMNEVSKKLGQYKLYDTITSEFITKTDVYYENNLLISKGKNLYNDNLIISYKGKEDFSLIPYEVEYEIDSKEVLDVLKKLGINEKNIPTALKIVIDLDDDGVDETIYEIYNSSNNNYEYDLYYSIICVKDGNRYMKLAYKEADTLFDYSYAVVSIIDFTNDGNYEIIVGERNNSFDEVNKLYLMYGLEDSEYVKLVSTN